jgi:diguanylate cyclase
VRAQRCSLLIVDDETYLLPTLAALLGSHFEVITADSAEAAQDVFARREIDLVLSDQKMPRTTGVQLLEWVREHSPNTIRLLMTGFAEIDDAVEAINRGHVYHYLMKPWRTEELISVLRNAGDKFLLERKEEQLQAEVHHKNAELQQLNADLERRVKDRTHAFEHANELLQQRTQELEAANQLLQQRTRELEILALRDPLTGLLNRRAIEDVAKSELKRHARYPSPLALYLIDVDDFKDINTKHLHTGGDEVLRAASRTLANSLRGVDFLGRWAGDEFLVVAPETDLEGAQVLGERIRSTIESSPIPYNGHTIHITVTVGFAVAEKGSAIDYKQMELATAAALGEGKNSGRNRCVSRSLHRTPELV